YAELRNNPEMMVFYNALSNLFFDLQKKVNGRKIGYQVPGYASSSVENVTELGMVEATKKNWKVCEDSVLKVKNSEQDIVSNEFGDDSGLMDGIRLRFNNQLPLELQTRDTIGAIMKWSIEAQYNISMQEAQPVVDSFIS